MVVDLDGDRACGLDGLPVFYDSDVEEADPGGFSFDFFSDGFFCLFAVFLVVVLVLCDLFYREGGSGGNTGGFVKGSRDSVIRSLESQGFGKTWFGLPGSCSGSCTVRRFGRSLCAFSSFSSRFRCCFCALSPFR